MTTSIAAQKIFSFVASKIKISDTPDKPKATFVRKSAFLSTGDSSFRFNFDLAPEQVDNKMPADGNTKEDANVGNTVTSTNSNTEVIDNAKKFKFSFSGSEFKFNFDLDKP